MKKLLSLSLALALALTLGACGSKPAPEAPAASAAPAAPAAPASEAAPAASAAPAAPATGDKPVLGVVMPNATHGFTGESIKHAELGTKELSEKYGFEYKFLTSGESSEQNNQIDTLINEKVAAIVLWPHNGDELRSAAQKAADANIPLVVYDRLITDFTPTAECMGDNETIGKMTGEYFNKYFAEDLKAGKVNVLEFKGDNSTVPQQRSDGFKSTADANINVVQQFSTDWQRAKAQEQMETFLTNSKKEDVEAIKAVFTHDDEVLLGVIDAIRNYSGDATLNIKLLSGVGGRKENLDVFASVKTELGIDQVTYSFSPTMVRDAIEIGAKIATGETVTGMHLVPTAEIDNASEAAFRESETYKIRYAE